MKKKTPIKPQLTEPVTSDFYLEDEMMFEGLSASNLDYSYLTCNNLILRDTTLERITMQRPVWNVSNVVMFFLKIVIFLIWNGLPAVSIKYGSTNAN